MEPKYGRERRGNFVPEDGWEARRELCKVSVAHGALGRCVSLVKSPIKRISERSLKFARNLVSD
jgi:hypothetical protein